MNDFTEMEKELRELRPLQPSPRLLESVSRELGGSTRAGEGAGDVIRPSRFGFGWLSLGMGLAAAAAFLVLARLDLPMATRPAPAVATNALAPGGAAPLSSAGFIPADATRVVYRTQDEGLHFARGSTAPVRRVRSRSRETLQWNNPETGASLRVSYPSEEVRLIPVAGQ